MRRMAGIVLGAGGSRRFGRPKQTLPLGDTTLLGWTLRAASASSLDRVVLVLGGAADEVLAGLDPGRAEVVNNPRHQTGCASSLRAGLHAAGPVAAIMLILGDMPGVDAELIDALRADWERHRPWASLTDYQDAPGHPLVFGAAAFPALAALRGEGAIWRLLEADPARVRRVTVARPLPADVDTPADYAAVRGGLGLASTHEGEQDQGDAERRER